MNLNTEYEVFAQGIYQIILDNDLIKNIKVEHNVKLKGSGGVSHQIDVYWEYEIGGVKQRVAIECKNYNSNVSLEKIRAFQATLTDIGGITGIFICKEGFQSGAIQFAKQCGIHLRVLKRPSKEDLELIKNLKIKYKYLPREIKLGFVQTSIKNIQPEFDFEWIHLTYDKWDINPSNTKLIVYDRDNNVIDDFSDMLSLNLPHNRKAEDLLKKEYSYDEGYLNCVGLGRVKIQKITITYGVDRYDEPKPQIILPKATALAIIKDIFSGKVKIIDHNNSVDED